MISDNNKAREYTIERLGKSNLPDLDLLHQAIYRKNHAPDYYEKKYDTAYTGVQYIGYIAYDQNHMPIAFYGVTPCFIRYDNELHLAAQSADAMTHPRYQFKSLFVQLANMTFDLCRDEGIVLVFGFPNQSSLHAFLVKLKFHMTEMMDCYIIPVAFVPLERLAKKMAFTRKFYKDYEQRVLKPYLIDDAGVENSVIRDKFAGINRNAHYLNYKAYHPTQVIKIGNALLWVKVRNGLIIGDMKCEVREFDSVMAELQELAFRLGVQRILFHTSHQTRLASLFAERYEGIPSYYVLFKDMGSHIPLDKVKFTYADIDIF
ncbi:MAG TPA: GNAT family N-acetyltransferase [Mucilaginibacter sp.]|nr:GNAT family N-acetyltransferase [Mucilaginibacter sp.]